MRPLIAALGLVASSSWADVKPAAVQVCLELPEGETLFASQKGPSMRAIGNGAWMLDLDVRFDGVAPEKVTRAQGSCLRAWLRPRKVRKVEVSFDRLAHNLVPATKDVNLELKSDLFYDAGAFAVSQRPFSTIEVGAPGTLTVERQTPAGPVVESPSRLPIGQYRITFTPAPSPRPCETRLEVLTVGSVTRERQPALLAELTAYYEQEFLPEVLKKLSVTCSEAEVAMVQTTLADGVFARPWVPRIVKRRLPEREPRFELIQAGARQPVDETVLITIEAGQHFDLVSASPVGEQLAASTP
ncbi:MAG: hypothetical protein JNJ54_19795 [Myxococcaceae bacterium]|nr:hypothetical protein [Myxococcaceae bacterium]